MMKKSVVVVCCAGLFMVSMANAQGPLAPPGAPTPTMKALDQVEARTVITNIPYGISLAGSYYLARPMLGGAGVTGITVKADNVTIDLNGFSLIGQAGSGSGIYVESDRRNTTVRNGSISSWGEYGIYAMGTRNGLYENLHLQTNGQRGLYGGINMVVRDCTAQGNGSYGFYVQGGSVLEGLAAYNNGDCGINCGSAGVANNCCADNNQADGIYMFDAAAVANCSAMNNDRHGFYVSSAGVLSDCVSGNNDSNGYFLGAGSVARGCSANENKYNGFRSPYESIMYACNARANDNNGFDVDRSTVRDCHAGYNDGHGIVAANRCRIAGNSCNNNGWSGDGYGICVTGDHSRVENNSVIDNDAGLVVNGSDNLVINNSASDNGNGATNYIFATDNATGVLVNAKTAGITTTSPWVNIEY